MASSRPPGLRIERELLASGCHLVAGIDEVGKGSWAGPLTVAVAVVDAAGRPKGIRDSKMLAPARREQLYDRIVAWAPAWSVGHASSAECDGLGMSEAQRLATRRAFDALGVVPDAVLVDGSWDFVRGVVSPSTTTRTIVKGDRVSLSIATASILAKVTRDRIMRDLAQHYPFYAFESNKGYPCPRHKVALQGYGASAVHRRSWVFMDSLIWAGPQVPSPSPAQLVLAGFSPAEVPTVTGKAVDLCGGDRYAYSCKHTLATTAQSPVVSAEDGDGYTNSTTSGSEAAQGGSSSRRGPAGDPQGLPGRRRGGVADASSHRGDPRHPR